MTLIFNLFKIKIILLIIPPLILLIIITTTITATTIIISLITSFILKILPNLKISVILILIKKSLSKNLIFLAKIVKIPAPVKIPSIL
jgi:hypothetical protein